MQINLQQVGKRFNRDWIFRKLDYQFHSGESYAITGSNGSGKSTLLQIISGAMLHSEGKIIHTSSHDQLLDEKEIYRQVSIAAPYLELIEEMTAREFLGFHAGFKPLKEDVLTILDETGLLSAADKQIRYYSSGMKQRMKLAQAFFSDTPILLLDEPTTNLDEQGIQLYQTLISSHTKNRLVIVCSNDLKEYNFCGEVIKIEDYKISLTI